MPMHVTFYGNWNVEVISNNSPGAFWIFTGVSEWLPPPHPDPAFLAVVGASQPIAPLPGGSNGWLIQVLWKDPNAPFRSVCELKKLSADFLSDQGLVETIGARRGAALAFDELVVRLRNTDSNLNPFVPISHPDFTYKRRVR
jgi:hypothetical protein